MYEKSSILRAGAVVRKNSSVASGLSFFKIHYFDYLKRFISKINDVYDFSMKYRYSDILLIAIFC